MVALVLLVAGCGEGGGVSGNTEDASGLTSAARQATRDLVTGDAAGVYDYLSTACKKRVGEAAFTRELDRAQAALRAEAGSQASSLGVGEVTTRGVRDGRGQARAQLLGADGSRLGTAPYQDWVYEDGDWRIDDCRPPADLPTGAERPGVGPAPGGGAAPTSS